MLLLGPPEKTERISSDFASKKIRVKTGFDYLIDLNLTTTFNFFFGAF
jgi:hypothetical protein